MSRRSFRLLLLLEVFVNDVEHALPDGALAVDPVDRFAELRSRPSRCVRPSTVRTTTPASSSTFTCLEIAGLETPKPTVASPSLAGPLARRSTIPRRIGCAREEGADSDDRPGQEVHATEASRRWSVDRPRKLTRWRSKRSARPTTPSAVATSSRSSRSWTSRWGGAGVGAAGASGVRLPPDTARTRPVRFSRPGSSFTAAKGLPTGGWMMSAKPVTRWLWRTPGGDPKARARAGRRCYG